MIDEIDGSMGSRRAIWSTWDRWSTRLRIDEIGHRWEWESTRSTISKMNSLWDWWARRLMRPMNCVIETVGDWSSEIGRQRLLGSVKRSPEIIWDCLRLSEIAQDPRDRLRSPKIARDRRSLLENVKDRQGSPRVVGDGHGLSYIIRDCSKSSRIIKDRQRFVEIIKDRRFVEIVGSSRSQDPKIVRDHRDGRRTLDGCGHDSLRRLGIVGYHQRDHWFVNTAGLGRGPVCRDLSICRRIVMFIVIVVIIVLVLLSFLRAQKYLPVVVAYGTYTMQAWLTTTCPKTLTVTPVCVLDPWVCVGLWRCKPPHQSVLTRLR